MSKQRPFGLIVGSILLAVSPLSLLAGELTQANPLQGRWVFNIPETVEALKYADLTDEEHRRFSKIFKLLYRVLNKTLGYNILINFSIFYKKFFV